MLKAKRAIGLCSRPAQRDVPAGTPARCTSQSLIRRLSPARLLRIEQSASGQVQISERRGNLKPVQILRQASVAHLLKAKDSLDHSDRVLDLGPNLRLGTILCLLGQIDPAAAAIPTIGEILGAWSSATDRIGLTLIALITPYSGLSAVQQILQRFFIRNIG